LPSSPEAAGLPPLQSLAGSGSIEADYAVRCQVIADDADAAEISLTGIAERESMHLADECEALRDLGDKACWRPMSVRASALPEALVNKRLNLGVIIAAYHAGKLDLEQVMALPSATTTRLRGISRFPFPNTD
jgi:ParB family chromosome partitioning protein